MECEKVREKFSSLLEGDLPPSEERIAREHLASCAGCHKDFEQFQKTLRWLHSLEEVEVPEGFLPGIAKKMEDRKRVGLRPGWFHYLGQFKLLKLPVQAVAMVAIVFLVLYLTKMTPVERLELKEVEQTKVSQPEAKKEAKLVQKEAEKEKVAVDASSETPAVAPKAEEERTTTAAYVPKAELPTAESKPMKDTAKTEGPPVEREKGGKELIAEKIVFLAAKPPQEIILRMSDREKAVSQLHEIVKQFGGEIVKEEGNVLLASLPTASFSEFKSELEMMSSPKKVEQAVSPKEAPIALSPSPKAKREEAGEKEPARSVADQGSRITIRILLFQD